MGFFMLGFKTYINFFLLKGLPFLALCFLFILEVISHTAKAFSLSIRLFANMTAGHTLMHILAGGLVNILKLPFFGFFGLIPLIIFILVCLMELGISILQAYVFFILIVIYFNDAVQTSQHQLVSNIYVYKDRQLCRILEKKKFYS
jgi:F-type H+-transporting ATPase subunit a